MPVEVVIIRVINQRFPLESSNIQLLGQDYDKRNTIFIFKQIVCLTTCILNIS